MEDIITIDSVFLSFGATKILRGVSLVLQRNQVTGILGRNGSGKSCLMKIITGQLDPQSKHIRYQGRQLIDLYNQKGLINYLPQHEFHPKAVRLKDLLSYYGIAAHFFLQQYPFFREAMNTRFAALSGGERRLLEVLLVLESSTQFTLLDEPFTQLMPKHIALVKHRINTLKLEKGILLTDHQYQNVLEVSDTVYLMRAGTTKKIAAESDLAKYGYLRRK